MSETKVRTGRPRFTGVHTYNDPQGRYEFRHPWDWEESELDNDLDGVIVRPELDEDATYFAVWVKALETSVVAEDLAELSAGFDEGLNGLPDAHVLHADEKTYNNLVKLERDFTFTEDGHTRKRRVWAMYADYWQFLVVYQAATVEEFDYWEPMGNYCFSAFNLPYALWFATDPSVNPMLKKPEDAAASDN